MELPRSPLRRVREIVPRDAVYVEEHSSRSYSRGSRHGRILRHRTLMKELLLRFP